MNKLKRLIPVFLMLILMSAPVYADDYQDGLDAYKKKDYKTLFEKFKPLAEQGVAEAQFNLAQMYRQGQGVTQDDALALNWYRKSAEQGIVNAQNHLGAIYDKGLSV